MVLQCGADSLAGDRLGCFNLTLLGHASCVEYVKSFNLPMLVLGGGGYTVRNVARCWAYETSVLLGVPVSDDIPYNDFYEYYAPDYKLHLTASTTLENANKPERLEELTSRVLQNLKYLAAAPSVQMHVVPPDWLLDQAVAQELEDAEPDARLPAMNADGSSRVAHPAEAYEGDRDGDREQRRALSPRLLSAGSARPEEPKGNAEEADEQMELGTD